MKKYNLNQIIVEEYRKIVSEDSDPCAQVKKLESKILDLEKEKKVAEYLDSLDLTDEIEELRAKLSKARTDCEQKSTNTADTSKNNSKSKTPTTSKSKVGSVQKKWSQPKEYMKISGRNGSLSSSALQTAEWLGVRLSKTAFASLKCIYNKWMNINKNRDKKLSNPVFVSGYRSYQEQWDLVDWHYVERKNLSDGKGWQTIIQGGKRYPIAPPGQSNHGWGDALDVRVDNTTGSFYEYLKSNGKDYGWSWPLKEADAPHFKYDSQADKMKTDYTCRKTNEETSIGERIWNEFKNMPWYGYPILALGAYVGVKSWRTGRSVKDLVKSATFRDIAKKDAYNIDSIILQLHKDKKRWSRFVEEMRVNGPAGDIMTHLTSLEKSFIKEIELSVKEGKISQSGGSELIRIVRRNKSELVQVMRNRTFKSAMDLYKRGKLPMEDFIQFFPKSMRESPAFLQQFEYMYKGGKKLPPPFKMDKKSVVKYRNGITDPTSYEKLKPGDAKNQMYYHPNRNEITRLYREGKLPIETLPKMADDVAEQTAFTLSMGKAPKTGASTRNLRFDRKYIKQVLKEAPATRLPEKWFTKGGYPKSKAQWRKEYEDFVGGELPVEKGSIHEQRAYNNHYIQVEAYRLKNGTKKIWKTQVPEYGP